MGQGKPRHNAEPETLLGRMMFSLFDIMRVEKGQFTLDLRYFTCINGDPHWRASLGETSTEGEGFDTPEDAIVALLDTLANREE